MEILSDAMHPSMIARNLWLDKIIHDSRSVGSWFVQPSPLGYGRQASSPQGYLRCAPETPVPYL